MHSNGNSDLPESGAGYESESDVDTSVGSSAAQEQPKPRKSDEMRRNFKAVFGHGPGKFALMAVGAVVVIGVALGYRGMQKPASVEAATSKVDVPRAPTPDVSVAPVSADEAARRAEAAAREAADARAKGETYQPPLDPVIADNERPEGMSTAFVPESQIERRRIDAEKAQREMAAAEARARQEAAMGPGGAAAQNAEALRKQQQDYKAAVEKRDEYVQQLRDQVLKQVEGLAGGGQDQQPALNALGSYSSRTYYPDDADTEASEDSRATTGPSAAAAANPNAAPAEVDPFAPVGDPKAPLLIKTGNILYATLDAEMNTDDGGEVLATVRGGEWDGSKVIGTIEQAPNNVRVKFTIMSPQDARPTMRINAVALREEDAKQGIADDIDRHTFSRYTALAAASLLSGYGRAMAINPGTTIITPGGNVITTTEELSDERIVGIAAGEMGTAIAAEVRQGFNRPPTYSTPAQKGIALYFTRDVFAQTNR